MDKSKNQQQRILEMAKGSGVIHARDLKPLGTHPESLRRLCAKGLLVKISRGLYTIPDAEITENHGLVQVSKAVPKAVVCLLSALRFHGIGTQAPHEIWIAINRRAIHPRISYPKMRIVRFSGKALTEGIQETIIEGVTVKIYNPAKTIADCFKYRNKIGLDVALEALREGQHLRKYSNDDLWRYAKICRVADVMRPYMEAIS